MKTRWILGCVALGLAVAASAQTSTQDLPSAPSATKMEQKSAPAPAPPTQQAPATEPILQTPAQTHEVRSLMRRAGVAPKAATVDPRSPLLRSIAGPPARPVPQPERPVRPSLAAVPGTGHGAVAASAGYRGRRRR